MTRQCIACAIAFFLLYPKPSCAAVVCAFKGDADLSKKKVDLTFTFPNGSSIAAQLVKTTEKNFRFSGTMDNVQTPIFEISSVLESSMEAVPGRNGSGQVLRGTIESKYSLVNYKPASELSGYFEIKNERLYLSALSWGGFVLDGYI